MTVRPCIGGVGPADARTTVALLQFGLDLTRRLIECVLDRLVADEGCRDRAGDAGLRFGPNRNLRDAPTTFHRERYLFRFWPCR